MDNKFILFGEDLGMGANKLYSDPGGLEFPSHVAVNGQRRVTRLTGLRREKPPLLVRTSHGEFYVGSGAHDWGRPVENLDYNRLTGAPEMRALLYGAFTRYIQTYGPIPYPVRLIVGLPLEPLSGEHAKAHIQAVRQWLEGEHTWQADHQPYALTVERVKVTSQPVGALFDYLLDAEGQYRPSRKKAIKQEMGIISIGFNTVELLVVRDQKPVQRFTTGTTAGVRRLLEIVNHRGLYSLGELDTRLRQGKLNLRDALPVWEREVSGVIERVWGNTWRRFARIIVVGGGALLLNQDFFYRFQGKAFLPDQPVLSIARGLYKLGRLQASRRA